MSIVQQLERVPPQNLEAEQGVLGSMLLDRDAIARVVEAVRAEDFYRDAHRVIFAAMVDLFERGEPVDLITITNRLTSMGKIEDVGGATYLASLPNVVPTAANVDYYAGIVLEKSMLRALINAGTHIAALGYEGADDIAALIDHAERLVFGIAARRNVQDFQVIKEILKESFEKIDKRYQEKGTVTGVSTSFSDLDMMTSGLQPSDMIIVAARPSVGKCVSAGAEITLEDGSVTTIEEVVLRRHGRLLTLSADWTFRWTEPSAFVDDGCKPVFRVTTGLGRSIECTAIHPFLTVEGWLPLASLRAGDRIAVPRTLGVFGSVSMRECEVKLLAYLIGDGSLTGGKAVFTNTDPRLVEDFAQAVDAFGAVRCQQESHPGGRRAPSFAVTGDPGKNPLVLWLAEHELWGKGAAHKEIPRAVFTLPRPQLALFLNRLFATDGWACAMPQHRTAHVGYATVRKRLVRQLQHLLLRFGVIARVRRRSTRYLKTQRVFWQLQITEPDSLQTFARQVGIFGKEDQLERVLELVALRRRKPNVDRIPVEIWTSIAASKGMESWASVARRAGLRGVSNIHAGKRALSRERLGALARAMRSDVPQQLASSDVYWDRIASIEPAGMKHVYDLTVPVTHNFIANDVLVHNTTFSLNIAQHAALQHKIPVAIFSLETSKEQLVQRILCAEAQVDNSKLRTGFLADDDWRKLARAMGVLSEAPIFIDDSATLSVVEMRAKARKLKAEHGLGLIVIDYIQLIQSFRRTENRTQELSEIARNIKSLAKELDVPIIAISQLSRAVEALGQKRPMLSHLRECVTGDTLVLLADGRRVPIRNLVGTTPPVLSMAASGKIVHAIAEAVWPVGCRDVVEVRLASGRATKLTQEHRLFSGKGWARARDLSVGDRIAIAREIPQPLAPDAWPEAHVTLLAHLIGDGCYLHSRSISYTTSSEENSAAVAKAALEFGASVHYVAGRRTWHQLRLSGNGNRWHPGKMKCWLEDLGIYGQRSHEKRIPAPIFRLSNEQIGLFLRHLWATDGAIWTPDVNRRAGLRVFYATNSSGLAFDVAALLLRLGIVARVYRVKQGRFKPQHHVVVIGVVNQRRYLERVGTFGPRVAQGERLRLALAERVANTNVDTLPREVFGRVRALMRKRGITQRAMATLRGTSYGGTAHFKFAPSRATVLEYARLLDDADLLTECSNDLFWDRIVSIEPAGREEVYDLTVPGPASWLADGIVTHNSGEIEQVSDLVLFLYREDYYDQEKAQKENKENICEVIIAKHRNGPIGTVELYFHKEHSRFDNLAKQR